MVPSFPAVDAHVRPVPAFVFTRVGSAPAPLGATLHGTVESHPRARLGGGRLRARTLVPEGPRRTPGGRLAVYLLIAAPFLAALPAPLFGQAAPAAPALQVDVAAVEARIRALEAEETRALVARDREALRRLWAEDFTVNAPRNVVVRGRDRVLALMDSGVIDYARFERETEVLPIDGDMALVMGWETVHPRGRAPMAGQVVRRRFTNIWRLRGGDWVQVARHAHVVTGG